MKDGFVHERSKKLPPPRTAEDSQIRGLYGGNTENQGAFFWCRYLCGLYSHLRTTHPDGGSLILALQTPLFHCPVGLLGEQSLDHIPHILLFLHGGKICFQLLPLPLHSLSFKVSFPSVGPTLLERLVLTSPRYFSPRRSAFCGGLAASWDNNCVHLLSLHAKISRSQGYQEGRISWRE